MDTASEPRHGGSVPVRSSGKVRAMGPGLGSAALVQVSKTTGSSRQVRSVGPGLGSAARVEVSKTTGSSSRSGLWVLGTAAQLWLR